MPGGGTLGVVIGGTARLGRLVTLVLVSAADGVLGAVPPFVVATPFWQEVAEVVEAARELHRLEVVVLRLLRAEAETSPDGGPVVYLAEVAAPPRMPLAAWPGDPLAPHPLRAAYAEPGGPQADLERGVDLLTDVGRPLTGRPEQIRTWNLSSIWRLPTSGGPVWLKSVPPMFAHEGPVLEFLRALGAAVPDLLGRWTTPSGSGLLLADVQGVDHYSAGPAVVSAIADRLIDLQVTCSARRGEMEGLGVPDGGDDVLLTQAEQLLPRIAPELPPAERAAAERFVADLPKRLAAVAGCGLPVTLVHGDAHPGNARGPRDAPMLLDWGDSQVGQPARDLAHLVAHLPPVDAAHVLAVAASRWHRAAPGSDAARAARLAAPIDALAGAIAWQGFLDRIEPDEWPYHDGDPAAGMRAALRRLPR
jgi:hypothetical protein